MPAPHPPELRQRIIDAYENGEGTYVDIAERFLVGEASVSRWLGLHRRTGSVDAKPMGGNRRGELPADVQQTVLALVRDEPNWTTEELSEQIEEEFNLAVGRERVGRFLRKAGFSFKRGYSDRQHPESPSRGNGETPISTDSPGWTPLA